MVSEIPTCRWGIVATGMISSWFVEDLVLDRPDAKAKHIIQCIGSSTAQKGKDFAAKYCPDSSATIYSTYDEVYSDPDVDCVYIGTPIAFHKLNCLDAIAAGKNVLCEKAFTINAREAREVFDAARKKGVYVHEAMWLRHRPLVAGLRKMLFDDKVIGDVFRMHSDFALFMDIPNLPSSSRYKDLNLGAGTLLDIGIYPLTWALLILDQRCPGDSELPTISAKQTLDHDGIEVTTSVILQYPSTGRQATISSTTMTHPITEQACHIQGTEGYIEVHGPQPSFPLSFTVHKTKDGSITDTKEYTYPRVGRGLIYEADDTAIDIAAGRKESAIVPWKETVRVMEIMDEIRRQGGTRYPQDEQ